MTHAMCLARALLTTRRVECQEESTMLKLVLSAEDIPLSAV